jgi:2-methylcitrate synthase
MPEKKSYAVGLEGVIAGETAIATVDKSGNSLMYRGYSLNDCVDNCIFEEVAYLLTRGQLPNARELEEYKKRMRSLYELPAKVRRVLETLPADTHPMAVLEAACVTLGCLYPEPEFDSGERTRPAELLIADRLLALFPGAICYHYRLHKHGQIINTAAQDESETLAKHFLRMLHQKEPSTDMVKCMDNSLVCYSDHGFCASTFAARVTASTLSDSYSSVASAIGTLKGPLHGSANEKAFYLIDSFKSVDGAIAGVKAMLAKKVKIMGFGHRVYKVQDPRAPILRNWALKLTKGPHGRPDLMAISDAIQTTMKQEKRMFPNVDFPAAMAYHQLGIPTNMFTPLFVCARTAGWMSHIMEQREGNRLIRPKGLYVGPDLKPFLPMRSRL